MPHWCQVGYRTVSTLARAVYGRHLIYRSPREWGRLRKERRCTVTQWSLATRHCLFRLDPRYGRRARSVNCLVCVDITHGLCGYSGVMTSWFSVTVFVDSIHWSHKCLWRRCQPSFDGVVPGGSPLHGWFQVVPTSCRRCPNHMSDVCGTLKRLVPSTVLKLVCSIPTVLSLSTMVRP